MSTFTVVMYEEKNFNQWDDFVLNTSVNGTFLQTRTFLNYHPFDRFVDNSLMILDGKHLVAVVPGCKIEENGHKTFFSHRGSTYGGIVISPKYYFAEKTIAIVKALDEYLNSRYNKAVLKITADIHSISSSDLLQYALRYCGYDEYTELNTYVNLENIDGDVRKTFDRNKIRNIRKCEEQRLYFRALNSDLEIEGFHRLLEINLSKYSLKPIHSVQEMISFKKDIIPDNIRFYGVFHPNNSMMAAGMMFIFEQANVIHAQNLSADYRFEEYSPITYMYYRIIEQAKKDGYRALSWGISTENNGKVLNLGLIRNKEAYGSKHQLNRTFYKIF